MLALFSALLDALAEYFKWMAARARIDYRRVLLDEEDKIDKENAALQSDLDDAYAAARRTGSTVSLQLADRLRERLAERSEFASFVAAGLSTFKGQYSDSDNGGNLPPANQSGVGVGTASPAIGTGEHQPAGSDPKSGSATSNQQITK